MAEKNDLIQAQLAHLRQQFAAKLTGRLDVLSGLARDLEQPDRARQALNSLHQQLHQLAGASGTFGFKALGEKARDLEVLAQKWLAQADLTHLPVKLFQSDIGALFDMLSPEAPQSGTDSEPVTESVTEPGPLFGPELEADPAGPSIASPVQPDQAPPDATAGATPPALSEARRVYVVGSADCCEQMSQTLHHFGYAATCFADMAGAAARIAFDVPSALLVEITTSEEGQQFLTSVRTFLENLQRPLPTIFISNESDFEIILAVARARGEGFFTHPLDFPKLVDRLDQILQRRDNEPYRVMVVDDDEYVARHFELILLAAGMKVQTVTQPVRVLNTAAEFRPELILMDVNMPEYSGVELARALRLQEQWISTPIVYLSAIASLEEQIKAMESAGDDFLTKPISDLHLVAAVRVRVARARTLALLMTRDSLTGLMNHIRIKEQIAREVNRAQRKGEDLCVAMLDIDHFKQVNDTHGHAEGDKVIKTLAHLLRQRLRKSDSIGRYGGEEFAVVLPDCTSQHALTLLETIRRAFEHIQFLSDTQNYSVTLSAGIASIHQTADPAALIVAADEALYHAKNNGRNRVCLAEALEG